MRFTTLQRGCFLAGLIVAGLWATTTPAETTDTADLAHTLKAKDAAAAWEELDASSKPPPSPKEWATTVPTPKDRQKFYTPFVRALCDRSKDFYTRFPTDSHASEARLNEFKFTLMLVKWGDTSQQSRLDDLEKAVLKDPAIAPEKHFMILWAIAQDAPPEKARPMYQEILKSPDAPDKLKNAATDAMKSLDRMGQAVDLQFTAVDGRSVDLSKLRGKVVLVDFWATWCGPCVGEVPNVKKTYDQYHSKGFEIIGISLDKEKDKLTSFVAENKMDWPQFFDGQFWQNKYARQFGIESIPTMWLIDKKGKLRDMNAREDLSGGVQKLLAE